MSNISREQRVGPLLGVDDAPEKEFADLHALFGAMLHGPERVMPDGLGADEATAWIFDRTARLRADGRYIGLVAGSYDVPHDCHEWYLRHCLAKTAAVYLERIGEQTSRPNLIEAMTSRVALLVSIDSDAAIDIRKGGDPAKGGIPRPIYPWASRAMRIAGYNFSDGVHMRPVAAAVSKECQVDYANTPLESAYVLATELTDARLLDAYVVYDEHPQDLVNVQKVGATPIVIPSAIVYARDPRTHQEFTSSGIIKKIRGEA